ncbi:VanZ family protein [Modestobacter italicus]|uniref:VanZ family protein n=1 Tax=Modestobacter italicus (strain DSM 44449 / CECT 9708 / BC 501) TaxID=2732864 RepID=UPI001C93CB70|nr:VanZ family protein [Modestobacter italicus]
MPTTAHRVTTTPHVRGPGLLVPAALVVLLAIGVVTLGPSWFVADARRAVTAGVQALAAPWPGAVHRAQVEAVANVLLFVPVGALAALALRRSGPVLPMALGAGASVLVELAQTALPGRVPDLVDVATNTTGAVLGVVLATVCLAVRRRLRDRRPRRWVLSALVAAPLLVVGLAGCSSGGGVLTAEHGHVEEGEELSAFADVPAITRLDDALRRAVQDAAREAAADGVELHVSSGWRSAAYQQSLFDAAVERYGSPEAAREWVLGPEESSHVTGDAVDIGPTDAMSWLTQHGSDHGLCQTYANEMWHFELAVEPGGQCPAAATDPAAG